MLSEPQYVTNHPVKENMQGLKEKNTQHVTKLKKKWPRKKWLKYLHKNLDSLTNK